MYLLEFQQDRPWHCKDFKISMEFSFRVSFSEPHFLWNVSGNIVESEDFFVGNKAKGWISKRIFQENKAPQIFRKMNISFFGKSGVLFFLATPVLGFALLTYYRHFVVHVKRKCLVHGCNFFKELQRVVNKSCFSKPTIETPEKVWNMFKFKKKNTRTTWVRSFWCFYFEL